MPRRLELHWTNIAERMRTSDRIVLFLDFDGTLARMQPKPHLARVAPTTRQTLRRLARHPRMSIVVISGRRRADVQRRVGVREIQYLGLYGNENERPLKIDARSVSALHRVRLALTPRVAGIPGVWLEDKEISLAVHLRDAPTGVAGRIRRELRALVRAHRPLLGMLENLRDVEVVPSEVGDKGTVVRRLLAQPHWRDAMPLYFGDDLSDEPAFAAVKRGVAVLVAPSRPTRARYVVDGTTQVAACLRHMETALDA